MSLSPKGMIKNELKFIFIDIANPKKPNVIVRVIYRHPYMDLTDFNITETNYYKISPKNKNLLSYLETLMLTFRIIMSIIRPIYF